MAAARPALASVGCSVVHNEGGQVDYMATALLALQPQVSAHGTGLELPISALLLPRAPHLRSVWAPVAADGGCCLIRRSLLGAAADEFLCTPQALRRLILEGTWVDIQRLLPHTARLPGLRQLGVYGLGDSAQPGDSLLRTLPPLLLRLDIRYFNQLIIRGPGLLPALEELILGHCTDGGRF